MLQKIQHMWFYTTDTKSVIHHKNYSTFQLTRKESQEYPCNHYGIGQIGTVMIQFGKEQKLTHSLAYKAPSVSEYFLQKRKIIH